MRRLGLLVLLAAAACGGNPVDPSSLCNVKADCVHGLDCVGGKCVPASAACTCTTGERTCDGLEVLRCEDCTRHVVEKTCSFMCREGACVAPVCVPSARKCEAGALLECSPLGTDWVKQQDCERGCDSATDACAP